MTLLLQRFYTLCCTFYFITDMLTAHLKLDSYNEKLLKLRGFCKYHG